MAVVLKGKRQEEILSHRGINNGGGLLNVLNRPAEERGRIGGEGTTFEQDFPCRRFFKPIDQTEKGRLPRTRGSLHKIEATLPDGQRNPREEWRLPGEGKGYPAKIDYTGGGHGLPGLPLYCCLSNSVIFEQFPEKLSDLALRFCQHLHALSRNGINPSDLPAYDFLF